MLSKGIRFLATCLGIAALGTILTEVVLSVLLSYPVLLKPLPLGALRSYYQFHDREIVQFLPECAVYDPELTYTLRPGSCRFSNREFDTEVRVNRLGLRDDEASLEEPEVLVLGDSHALGWGVEQDETFAALLEAETGRRVLNAAMSSYGTVREMSLLRRIDTGGLRHLVIQYCDNDYPENRRFFANQKKLPIADELKYGKRVREHGETVPYFPGKHVLTLARQWSESWRSEKAPPGQRPDEADVFLYALVNAPVDLRDVRILVFELVAWGENDDEFIRALERRLAEGAEDPEEARILSNVVPVRMADVAGPEEYYVLDDHMRPRGHRRVADRLLSYF